MTDPFSAAVDKEQDRLIDETISSVNLYRGCEHILNDSTCDVMCDAYVRGDGMIAVETTNQLFLCWSSVTKSYMSRGHSASAGCNPRCGMVVVIRLEDNDE